MTFKEALVQLVLIVIPIPLFALLADKRPSERR
jgi:hypothetical protein